MWLSSLSLCLCVYVFFCCGMALILIRPFMLGGLPFLTYSLASLSHASPSVRGLHPKSFQMASFPPFYNFNSSFTLKSISS